MSPKRVRDPYQDLTMEAALNIIAAQGQLIDDLYRRKAELEDKIIQAQLALQELLDKL